MISRYHDNLGIYNIPILPTVGNFLILSVSAPSIVLHRIQSALFFKIQKICHTYNYTVNYKIINECLYYLIIISMNNFLATASASFSGRPGYFSFAHSESKVRKL